MVILNVWNPTWQMSPAKTLAGAYSVVQCTGSPAPGRLRMKPYFSLPPLEACISLSKMGENYEEFHCKMS